MAKKTTTSQIPELDLFSVQAEEHGSVLVVHDAIDGRQQYTVVFPSGEARCLERYLERDTIIANILAIAS